LRIGGGGQQSKAGRSAQDLALLHGFFSSPSLEAVDSQHRAALAVNVKVRRPGYFCPATALMGLNWRFE
jgi:hypothetical protein